MANVTSGYILLFNFWFVILASNSLVKIINLEFTVRHVSGRAEIVISIICHY